MAEILGGSWLEKPWMGGIAGGMEAAPRGAPVTEAAPGNPKVAVAAIPAAIGMPVDAVPPLTAGADNFLP